MPEMLRKLLLAAVIAWGAVPAWSAGMPEYGTKNFTPGADAPSYFTNETGVLGVAADFAADRRAAAPPAAMRAESEPRRAAPAIGHRHGKSAAAGHGAHRVASQARPAARHGHGGALHTLAAHDHGRPLQTTKAHGRGGSLHMASAKGERTAAAHRGAAAGRSTRSAKSGGKPAKARVRHVAAGPASGKG